MAPLNLIEAKAKDGTNAGKFADGTTAVILPPVSLTLGVHLMVRKS
jgi:hypothetical protein